MESKANCPQSEDMVLWILLLVLAVWGVVSAHRAVRVDGLRRRPTALILRRPETRA